MKRTLTLALFAAAVLAAPSAYADCITGGKAPGRLTLMLGPTTPFAYTAGAGGAVAAAADPTTIVGLWQVTFTTNDGAVWDYAYEQFHADGTEFTMDTAVTPAMGNVCIGVWKPVNNKAKLHHVGFNWDASQLPGRLAGTFVLDMVATVSRDTNSFRGTFVTDSFDVQGVKIDDLHAEGTVSASRITVQ